MYNLAENIKLYPIDANLEEDIMLTYRVLEERYKSPVINIKHRIFPKLPTLNQHKAVLKSTKYKAYYKILLFGVAIGVIYVDTHNILGLFFLNVEIKKVFKEQKIKKLSRLYSLCEYVCREMFKLHPDITVHYALINPKNSFSRLGLQRGGFEEIGILYAIETKNGFPIKDL